MWSLLHSADPESTTIDHDPPHFATLLTDPPRPTIEMDTSAFSDLEFLLHIGR